jgi:hypothetical protein
MSNSTSTVTSSMNIADSPASRAENVTAVPSPAENQSEGQKQAGASGSDSVTSGMNCQSQVPAPVAKQAGHSSLEGSNVGEHRTKFGDPVKATMDAIANPPAPREQMRGQQTQRAYLENGKGFTTTEAPEVGE